MFASFLSAALFARVFRDVDAEKSKTNATKPRRPTQHRPVLWRVRTHDTRRRPIFCGPAAVSALIGVDADAVVRAIQRQRGNDRPVEATQVYEHHQACREFGFEILPVDNLSDKPPTLARWERGRTDYEFDQAMLVLVNNHWLAVRGSWACDSFYSRFAPMRIRRRGPHRRVQVKTYFRL